MKNAVLNIHYGEHGCSRITDDVSFSYENEGDADFMKRLSQTAKTVLDKERNETNATYADVPDLTDDDIRELVEYGFYRIYGDYENEDAPYMEIWLELD